MCFARRVITYEIRIVRTKSSRYSREGASCEFRTKSSREIITNEVCMNFVRSLHAKLLRRKFCMDFVRSLHTKIMWKSLRVNFVRSIHAKFTWSSFRKNFVRCLHTIFTWESIRVNFVRNCNTTFVPNILKVLKMLSKTHKKQKTIYRD